MEGQDCGQEAGSWLSTFLGQECLRLIFSSSELKKKDASDEVKPWGNPALIGDQVTSRNTRNNPVCLITVLPQ